jgi:phosphoribosylformylglycinamidine cyclo-ligase
MDLYNQRGVSAQKEEVHAAIKNLDAGLFDSTFCKILPDYLTGSNQHCTIMHADTAGTKSILAYLYWKETGDLTVWKNIAQDALVMNIDDMICSGATGPFIVSSTIARNKQLIPGEVLHAVINGGNELLNEWKNLGLEIHLAGGETADVGDLVKTIDVGYTSFARLEREKLVHINPKPGDAIVGFASYGQATYETEYNSGIGCNGLTSARHDILDKYYEEKYPESFDAAINRVVSYIGKHRLTDPGEMGLTIGQMLLSPTRTYAPLIKKILEKHFDKINGIIHNTGGGQTKCLKFIKNKVKLIKDNLFEPPLIFKLIAEAGKAGERELYQVFNMGQRLEIFTDPGTAEVLVGMAETFAIEAKITGWVEAGVQKELLIQTRNNLITYL